MASFLTTLAVYVKAYGRHLLRSSPWVTLACALLALMLLFVPQAAELILSQATLPEAREAAGSFYWRLVAINAAALVLALSIWLSARMLVSAEWNARETPAAAREQGPRSYRDPAGHRDAYAAADAHAALQVPRVLGLTVFLTLQIAAARSISVQSYFVPIALVGLWLALLVLGLMRISEVKEARLRPWWIGLLAGVALYAWGAVLNDEHWLGLRALDPDWQPRQLRAIWLMGYGSAGMAIGLIALAWWVTKPGAGGKRQAAVTVLALAGIVACFELAGAFENERLYTLFFLTQSLMALLYWALVLGRRQAAAWLSRSIGGTGAGRIVLGWSAARLRWFVGAAITGATALFVAWAVLDPIGMGGYVGAMGIVLMFFAFLVLAVAALQARIARSSWHRVVPGGWVAIGLLAVFFFWPTPPQRPPQEEVATAPRQESVRQALAKLPEDNRPIFALAAHGGGIRAALYTASFAAWLDHYTGYEFSNRLVAASGASGGSVGLAVWAAARAAGCADRPAVGEGQRQIPACVQAVNETLAQDHLSPLIATGLFRDYFLFLANPERGNTLQQSILNAAARVHGSVLQGLSGRLKSDLTAAPFPLMLNATEVGTAIPYALVTREGMLPTASQEPGRYVTYVPSSASSKISLLTAAMHSARFPLISPKAIVFHRDGPTVVDGGYFDNSGVAVLRQHILGLQSHYNVDLQRLRQQLVVVSLDNEPIASVPPRTTNDDRNSLDEILGTILAARGAHGQAAWYQLCTELDKYRMYGTRPGAFMGAACRWPSELDEDDNVSLWQVQHEAQGPALGWSLSPRSARRLTTDARVKAYDLARDFMYPAAGPERPEGAAIRRDLPMP